MGRYCALRFLRVSLYLVYFVGLVPFLFCLSCFYLSSLRFCSFVYSVLSSSSFLLWFGFISTGAKHEDFSLSLNFFFLFPFQIDACATRWDFIGFDCRDDARDFNSRKTQDRISYIMQKNMYTSICCCSNSQSDRVCISPFNAAPSLHYGAWALNYTSLIFFTSLHFARHLGAY